MGDPWKSITPKGVQAFVNGSIATLIVWLTVENHLSIVSTTLSNFLSSEIFGLIVYYLLAIVILYKLLYKRSAYDVNEKRATKFAILSMILIWLGMGRLSLILGSASWDDRYISCTCKLTNCWHRYIRDIYNRVLRTAWKIFYHPHVRAYALGYCP